MKNLSKLLLAMISFLFSLHILTLNSDGFTIYFFILLFSLTGTLLFFIYKYPKENGIVLICSLVYSVFFIIYLVLCFSSKEISVNDVFTYTKEEFAFFGYFLGLYFSLEFLNLLLLIDDYREQKNKHDIIPFFLFGILVILQLRISMHPKLCSYQEMEYFSQFLFPFAMTFLGYFIYKFYHRFPLKTENENFYGMKK